ncbi:MAG: Na+/H+ antiporter subunit E [Bacteroidales bacterium]|nr:Na+/H+ antiporter subunit E [Bacteroidales bacterium]MDD3664894.1 Na+/H+ antiporter subunit E [Bacteroidales bacterium]
MKLKNALVSFVLLITIWLILNNSLKPDIILTGVVLAGAISIGFCRQCNLFGQMKITPKAMLFTLAYLLVFMWELLKANFDVALRVVSPTLPINPAVVKGKTKLKSEMARMILANSITLTPGTFTLDLADDELTIHCLNYRGNDPEGHAQSIIRNFEKYLEVLYD